MRHFIFLFILVTSSPVFSQDFLPVDYPVKVKYGNNGFTYLTGKSLAGKIFITVRNSTSGGLVWTDEYDSPFSTPNDRGIDITFDNINNVYVTGYVYDDIYDVLRKTVLKYSTSGGLQWSTIFYGNDWESSGISIVADDDYVYSCGFLTDYNLGTERDFYVQKLDRWFGNVQWTQQYNDDIYNGDDIATSLLVDLNFVYILGYSYRGQTNLNDIVLIGLDKTTGDIEPDYPEIYQKIYSNEYPTDFIFAEDLSSDARKHKTAVVSTSDNINIVNQGSDYLTLLFDGEEGSPLLWARTFNGGDTDVPLSIDLDVNNNIFVTGYSYQNRTGYDFATVAYDITTGNSILPGIAYFFDNENGIDQGTSVLIGSNAFYVSGYSELSETGFYTVAYSINNVDPLSMNSNPNNRDSSNFGKILWEDHHIPKFGSNVRSEKTVYAISALDSAGNIIVTGVMADENGFRYTIYSYDSEGKKRFEVEDDGSNYNEPTQNIGHNNTIVSTNFPNPFNPVTKINYQLPTDNFVTLKVYDILGKEVAVLVNSHVKAGSHTVTFNASNLASGVYYYRIQAGGMNVTKRIMLIK